MFRGEQSSEPGGEIEFSGGISKLKEMPDVRVANFLIIEMSAAIL